MFTLKQILTLFLLNVLFSLDLIGQVTIAPTNMFIDSKSKFGSYMVINGSNQAQEISVDFFFGFSTTNSEGMLSLATDTGEVANLHSIANNVRAFPKNFILPPGQRQTVRVRIGAPNTLKDGTYWARIKTVSQPQSRPVELQNTNILDASVSISIEQITGLFYKKGVVNTGIDINEITTNYDKENNSLTVLTKLKRIGNSPFLGTITNEVTDENGQIIKSGFVSTSIYFDGVHRHVFNMEGVDIGSYNIKVTFESKRGDISSTDLVGMTTVSETSSFVLQ